MSLTNRYEAKITERRIRKTWQVQGIYQFSENLEKPVYSIDTPPPTVSGQLHLGHVYSYSHTDFIARYRRMRGNNVFYPMGYDDNGLPTERLVEKSYGIDAREIGRAKFIEKCLQASKEAEKDYQELWQRLGLSIDWRYTFRTIDERSRRINQLSFLDLYNKGLAYRRKAPAIWCPACRTALAQADLNDLDRESEYSILRFTVPSSGEFIPIATTRPELLPACVAVFVHPEDQRYQNMIGQSLVVPLFGQRVPIIEDSRADPIKGTGVVMCCTFGDSTDVAWWYSHQLPLIEAIDKDGRMTQAAKEFEGLSAFEARRATQQALKEAGYLLDNKSTMQTIRVHERCDTPVEYVVLHQWFIRLLDFKTELLQAGDRVKWHPEHMLARYKNWVENLNWDWCISRQRYFGVPFPVWYCEECGQIRLAEKDQLPVDPVESQPAEPCDCGSTSFVPELDVQDTWATSSLSPQIYGHWPEGEKSNSGANLEPGLDLYSRVFPYSLRPQAHEIIRTWAFYTITKSWFHFGQIPWKEALISGWGLAGEGMGKISKSRGGGPMSPMEMIERYSADAVRYWAASTGPGKDALISEEKIQMGTRLVNKIWNVARFSERFLAGFVPSEGNNAFGRDLTPADRWILASLQRLIRRTTDLLEHLDYAAAKSEVEDFFWNDLADNYLEMCKQRLYDEGNPWRDSARFSLYQVLLNTLKLLAPFLPYVTEEIYLNIYRDSEGNGESIHTTAWPNVVMELDDPQALAYGQMLVEIATAVRRYKSEHNLPLGYELTRIQLAFAREHLEWEGTNPVGDLELLKAAIPDLTSITRAHQIEALPVLEGEFQMIGKDSNIYLAIED